MGPQLMHGSKPKRGLILLLLLGAPLAGLAKTKTRKGGDSDLSDIIRPTLINAQTDPTLRYPVMNAGSSVFSITYGWLDISSGTLRYSVVEPTSKSSHSFQVARVAINNVRLSREWLTFRAPKSEKNLIYLPQDRWGTVHSGPGMGAAANRESLGTSSIYKTLMNFDGVMALVKPPPPLPAPVVAQPVSPAPPPKPVAPPSPPAIVLSSPAGASASRTIEVQESTVVIRGVAMDSSGIPVVRINGAPANMRPQTTQAAEFWSDPLPLKAGSNPIQVVASNAAHLNATVDFTISYAPKVAPINPRALDKTEIISLLQGGVPVGHVVELVRDRGVKFTPNAEDLNDLRAAGADDDLIQAIQRAAPASK